MRSYFRCFVYASLVFLAFYLVRHGLAEGEIVVLVPRVNRVS